MSPMQLASITPKTVSQKKLTRIWSQVPPDYYDSGIKNNPLQKLWHMHKLAKVKSFMPKNTKKVLDVGCSSGILTAEIQKILKNGRIIGIDSYDKAIVFAKSKYPKIRFQVADAHKIPFQNKSFDLVICTETLEHVLDPQKVLSEIKRVLKPQGNAIISMDSGSPLFRIIWYFWTKTKGRVWENAHLHEFNSKLLEEMIQKAGFKIKKKAVSHLGMAITFLTSPKN